MNIIPQTTKRYLPHQLKTRINAVKTYRNSGDIAYICRKYHISRTSLGRWNKKYDSSLLSLSDKSHKPISKHPNSHTDTEIKWIKNIIRRNPHITLNEIWYKLKISKGYSRCLTSLYRVLRRLNHYNTPLIKGTSKIHNHKYHTPSSIGTKWQIDVKYVPTQCKVDNLPHDINYYQYTCIVKLAENVIYFGMKNILPLIQLTY